MRYNYLVNRYYRNTTQNVLYLKVVVIIPISKAVA